jgi:autotransporter-associated beta strand protein
LEAATDVAAVVRDPSSGAGHEARTGDTVRGDAMNRAVRHPFGTMTRIAVAAWIIASSAPDGVAGDLYWNMTTSGTVTSVTGVANLTVGALGIGNTTTTPSNAYSTTTASSVYTFQLNGTTATASGGNNAGISAIAGALSTASSAYYQVTLSAATGYTFSLSSIGFGARSTSTGPQNYTLRSSVDSYAGDLITPGTIANTSTWAYRGPASVTSSGTSVTYRLYGYGGTGSQTFRIDDLVLGVTTSAADLWNGGLWTSSAAAGGSGTWADGSGNWLSTNKATFAGAAGTVTAGAVTAANGIAFGTTGYTLQGGTITLGGAAAANVITATTGIAATLNSVIAGSSGLRKEGGGTVTLGGVNTYSGTTAVVAGTLATAAGNVIGDASTVDVSSGATFALGGSDAIAALRGSGTVSIGAHTLTVGGAGDSGTFSGNITGSGGLTKVGGGALTLSGAVGFTGTTTVSGGRLNVDGSLASATLAVNTAGILGGSGTTGAVSIGSGGSISPGNSPGVLTTGNMVWDGGGAYDWEMLSATGAAGTAWDLVDSSGSLTINATSGNTFTLNLLSLSGSTTPGPVGNFQTNASGTWTIGTFAGGISVGSGTWWTITTGGFTPYNSALGSFSLANDSTTLSLVYTHTPLDEYVWIAGSGSWSFGGNWNSDPDTPEGDPAIVFAGPGGVSVNDIVSGTGPNELAGITGLTFSGSATGSYTVGGNLLHLGGVGIVNASSFTQTVTNGIELDGDSVLAANAGDLVVSGTVTTAGHGLTLQGANAISLGTVSGTGGLAKQGSGTATLTGPVSAATVSVTAGSLALGGANLLGDTAALAVSGGSLDLANFSDTVGTFSMSGGILAGSGTLSAATSTLSGGTVAATATLGGAAIVSTGNARLDGRSTASTLTLSSGTLVLGSAGRLAGGPAVDGSAGAGLALAGSETFGSLAGAANVVANSGTLTVGTANTSTSYAGTISGAGGLEKVGTGSLSLAGANTYTGPTTVSSGTLVMAAGGSLAAGSAVAVSSGATLAFDGFSTGTFANAVGGSGGLRVTGGIVTLSGANSYSGGTVVAGGSLVGTTTSLQGGITNDASLTFAQATSGTYSGTLVGSGTLAKSGAGTVTLSGNNGSFTGPTTISAGAIAVGSSSPLGTGGITLAGGTLSADGSPRTVANAVTFTDNGGLGNAASGALELSGPVGFGNALRTVTVGSGATATLSGGYGSGGISKAGAGVLVLGSSGTLTQLAITSGTLGIAAGQTVTTTASQLGSTGGRINVDGTLRSTATVAYTAPSGSVAVGPTGVVIQQGGAAGTANLLFDADVTWAAGSTFVFRDFSENPSVSGRTYAMNVVFDSSGAARTTTLSAGSNPWTVAGDLTVGDNVALNFSTFSGAADFQRNVIVGGTLGTVANGARGFTVNSGRELLLQNSGAVNIAASQAITVSGTIRSTATAGQTATIAGGTVSLAAGMKTFDVGAGTGAAGLAVSSVVTGAGGLRKTGAGLLTLTGITDFVGDTQVAAGRLAIGSSATLASDLIQVDAGATLDFLAASYFLGGSQTLGGNGTVAGADLVVAGGATIAPGASVGALTVETLTFGTGGVYQFELTNAAGSPGSSWDLVTVTDGFTLSGLSGDPAGQFTIDMINLSGTAAGFDPNADYRWRFLVANAAISSFDPTWFRIITTGFDGAAFTVARGGATSFDGGDDRGLYLVYAAVPEPHAVLLAGLGLALAGWAGRRRGRHGTAKKHENLTAASRNPHAVSS